MHSIQENAKVIKLEAENKAGSITKTNKQSYENRQTKHHEDSAMVISRTIQTFILIFMAKVV